jgi:hypothetical protein
MSLENIGLLTGGTIDVTGGTAQSFSPDGVDIVNGIHLADAAETDYALRESLTFRTRNPQLVNGVYGKAKRWATYTSPMVTAAGTNVFNVCRIELEVHPELSLVDEVIFREKAAQLLFDADADAFWSSGSLA